MDSFEEYLRPTNLCDFDQDPEIRFTAERLTQHTADKWQSVVAIYRFVKELPYVLEDWDVKASETLLKGKGMCCGKSNLLIAMCRAITIPARYQILKIKSEGMLWRWITQRSRLLAREMGNPVSEHDHVIAEVCLGKWETYDPSRDSALEEGLKKFGIPLERVTVADAVGHSHAMTPASVDKWAADRQESRRFRENRELVFSRVNE